MKRCLDAGLCLVALLVLVSCRPSSKNSIAPSLRRLNLVLVTLDTLRADRLGCYGYSKTATPNLDQLARKGILFENAVAQTPLTAPSHASIFTGLYPTVHQVRDTGGFVLPPSKTTLAQILQQQGWDTAAFVGASVLKKAFGFSRGFSVYDDQMPKPLAGGMASEFPERRAGEVVDRAMGWLNSQSGQPFFLWVHVFDPHSPYDPPPPFREKYRARPYDGEVAYTDQQLGRLFETIARKSPPETTLIAVLSDHGESLSEHGEYSHGVFLYDSTLRIAFLLSGPGVPAGLRVKQQARTIDLLPTILALMGGQAPPGIQGTSLAPAFTGQQVPTGDSYVETLFPKINMGWAELRGIRTNRWKYICAPKPELYDLLQDPAEATNVIRDHPAEAEALDGKLKAILGGGGDRNPEKVQTAMVDQRTLEQLKSLGYLGGSSQQSYTLTGKGIDPKDRAGVLKLLYLAVSPDAGGALARRIPLLRQALAEDPANPTLYYHLGQEYASAKRHGEAMRLCQEGIRNGVRTGWIYSRLGYLYLREGNRDEAIAAYERAAQLNPSDSESLDDLGMAYLETGRIQDAERVFQWSLASDDRYAPTHNGLGLVCVRKQDPSAARAHFEKAVQLDPDLMEAQLNLGRICKMIGANTRARACFQAFLAKASRQEYGPLIPTIEAELKALQ
ncbi:MAG: sulfatase-like hydrolase/transferase [Acidobacteria bacterium]|nr:sulfatase-like hydrolase/transferase [Acidobacteriota bacterium]